MDCIFCKIINNEISSYTIYEDDIVKVFLDINPSSNGHMLIVPKAHTKDITTIDSNTYLHIFNIALKMKILLEEKLNINGLTLIQNNGIAQDVMHYHLHLVPVYKIKLGLLDVKEIFSKLKETN